MRLHLYETSRIGRSIEIEGWWLPGLGIGEMVRNCLRDTSRAVGKMFGDKTEMVVARYCERTEWH